MPPEERLNALVALLVERMARLEAQNDVILKTQAHFLATLSQSDWKPIHDDLQAQVKEVLALRRDEVLAEMKRLSGS